jgi:hypothetical protein
VMEMPKVLRWQGSGKCGVAEGARVAEVPGWRKVPGWRRCWGGGEGWVRGRGCGSGLVEVFGLDA